MNIGEMDVRIQAARDLVIATEHASGGIYPTGVKNGIPVNEVGRKFGGGLFQVWEMVYPCCVWRLALSPHVGRVVADVEINAPAAGSIKQAINEM